VIGDRACVGESGHRAIPRNLFGIGNDPLPGGTFVGTALRNHHLWLALAYVGLILLLYRSYA